MKFHPDSFLTSTSSYTFVNNSQTFIRKVCTLHVSPQLMLGFTALLLLILILILDRIFYPMSCCQWVGTMFNRITAGMCFSMLSIVCALALEVWRHEEFSDNVTLVNTIKVPHYYNYDKNLTDSTTQTPHFVASIISVFTTIPQFIFHGVAKAFSEPTSKLCYRTDYGTYCL